MNRFSWLPNRIVRELWSTKRTDSSIVFKHSKNSTDYNNRIIRLCSFDHWFRVRSSL